MVEAVADTSVIIHLDELAASDILASWSVAIPPGVQREVAAGGLQPPPTVDVVWLRAGDEEAVIDLARGASVSAADAEVVVLARRLRAALVFTDDLRLRRVARVGGLRPVGTLGLVLRAARDGRLSIDEATRLLDGVVDSSLFVTGDLLDEARAALRRMDR